MKNTIAKDVLFLLVFMVVFMVTMFAFIWTITSPEMWYHGAHDGKCEKMLGKNHCKCYERIVDAEKRR